MGGGMLRQWYINCFLYTVEFKVLLEKKCLIPFTGRLFLILYLFIRNSIIVQMLEQLYKIIRFYKKFRVRVTLIIIISTHFQAMQLTFRINNDFFVKGY